MEKLAKQTEPCVGCLPSLSPGRTPTPCSQLSPEWEADALPESCLQDHAVILTVPETPFSYFRHLCPTVSSTFSHFSLLWRAGAPVLQLFPFCGSPVSVTMVQSLYDPSFNSFKLLRTRMVIVCTALLRREAPGLCSLCHPYTPSFKHTPSLPPTCPIPHFPNLTSLMGFCGPGWHAWDSPFSVCVHSLLSSLLYSLTLPTNWLFHNSTTICLNYKEGALERHNSTAVLPCSSPSQQPPLYLL